ncbi:MAG TPA: hydantoinase/oxoprolinase family protein [Pseudonocardia sp.]
MGVDIGGTFTDVAVLDESGRLRVGKVLTTPGQEDRGVLGAIEHSGAPLDSITLLVHGTTLVINALLERRGSEVVLVTTRGFRDVLELGRGNRPESFNLFYRRDPVLVPRQRRLEIAERTLADGTIALRPDEAELDQVAEQIRATGAQAVAVALLNSYAAPANEQYVSEELQRRLPGVLVSRSSDISRAWREFERFTTAVANAYVAPPINEYLTRIENRLAEQGFDGSFVMLDSNGGALSSQTARVVPVRLVESGPVGGALGAAELARRHDLASVVTFDIGGTTAKSTFVESGAYPSNDLYWIGGYDRGFPLQMSCIDIVEIGAGGGSIAWVDDAGRLRVGPRSAGAVPGPACYGNGGVEPTVTDADVYLGRLPAEYFVGSISISRALAADAIENLAAKLAMDPVRLAIGIVTLAELAMAGVVRHQTVSRGRDPREFTMVAFGGAGPIHACAVASEVGVSQVLVPPAPGHFSAIGMLNAPIRFDRREVYHHAVKDLDEAHLQSRLAATASDLTTFLPGEPAAATAAGALAYSFAIALRYQGQENTLVLQHDQPGLAVPPGTASRFADRFEAEHRRRYGYAQHGTDVEIVEYVVVVERPTRRAEISDVPTTAGDSGTVEVHFALDEDPRPTPVIPRSRLRIGSSIDGPVLIYETGSTTVAPPGSTVTATPDGSLFINLHPDRSAT